ncbi:HNH endonuclease [Salinibacterium sp. SYSU T00001]|uniref:HNH endonuclease n=1 Tax=Homoserinimonas sedimenticola TaxID=2986805 RepID=UPI002236AC07|nr:HNH endonuclease [Salinibacterium sedimenticola]MCW4386251.1 HNH endonuclease [Salinibacterium sedimenticola]
MYSREKQLTIRHDIFRWLDQKLDRGQYEYTREELSSYEYDGIRLPLLDRGRGIRNPATFSATLSIMTSLKSPYNDVLDTSTFVKYDYRSNGSSDNLKLKAALFGQDPLIYFEALRRGVYAAHYPVYVVADDPTAEVFTIAMDEALRFFGDPATMSVDQRRYAERTVKARLHQPAFRAKVMHAYSDACAICSLRHLELLDAAHIIADHEATGFASVTNGLALCKIHHAAYDRNLLGISPDYRVHIDNDLLDEVDGPMLRHGLQDMHGRALNLPHRKSELPSADALAIRFEQFAA